MVLNLCKCAPIFFGGDNLAYVFNTYCVGKFLSKLNLVIAVAVRTFKTYCKGFINLGGFGNIT